MQKLSGIVVLLVGMLSLTGCLSVSHLQAWSGPDEYQGKGGSFKTVDGIDVYSIGEPYKRYRVIGIIRNSTISNAGLMAVFGNSWATKSLVKEAKKSGADAIILLRKNSDQWTTGSTDAMGNYQTTTDVNTEMFVAVVKYVADKPLSSTRPDGIASTHELPSSRSLANLTNEPPGVETKFIGCWENVSVSGKGVSKTLTRATLEFFTNNVVLATSEDNGTLYEFLSCYKIMNNTIAIWDPTQRSQLEAENIANYAIDGDMLTIGGSNTGGKFLGKFIKAHANSALGENVLLGKWKSETQTSTNSNSAAVVLFHFQDNHHYTLTIASDTNSISDNGIYCYDSMRNTLALTLCEQGVSKLNIFDCLLAANSRLTVALNKQLVLEFTKQAQ